MAESGRTKAGSGRSSAAGAGGIGAFLAGFDWLQIAVMLCLLGVGLVFIYSTGAQIGTAASAEFFARQGRVVVMTPKLDVPYKNPAYDMIYGSLRGTPYYGKCPDLLVDGVWYEHEGFCGDNPKRSFRNMCNHGFKQSSRIIIEDCGLTDGYMLRSVGGQQKAGVEISEVWIHRGADCQVLFKTED